LASAPCPCPCPIGVSACDSSSEKPRSRTGGRGHPDQDHRGPAGRAMGRRFVSVDGAPRGSRRVP
jgi:hypothetical protein